MKNFAQSSFFRLFDLLLSVTNPGSKRPHWTHDGVEFERERHSVTEPKHGLTIEIFTLTRPGRRAWSPHGDQGILVGRRGKQSVEESPLGAAHKRAA